MKTEKMSVNLSAVEMGQIDYLVDKGLYDSRSDFVRSAVRKAIERHGDEVDAFIKSPKSPIFMAGVGTTSGKKVDISVVLGTSTIKKGSIQDLIALERKLRIRVIGLLTIANDITADEIRQTIESCKVYGKLIASAEVKEALKELEEV